MSAAAAFGMKSRYPGRPPVGEQGGRSAYSSLPGARCSSMKEPAAAPFAAAGSATYTPAPSLNA
jgi:hypothetical protein